MNIVYFVTQVPDPLHREQIQGSTDKWLTPYYHRYYRSKYLLYYGLENKDAPKSVKVNGSVMNYDPTTLSVPSEKAPDGKMYLNDVFHIKYECDARYMTQSGQLVYLLEPGFHWLYSNRYNASTTAVPYYCESRDAYYYDRGEDYAMVATLSTATRFHRGGAGDWHEPIIQLKLQLFNFKLSLLETAYLSVNATKRNDVDAFVAKYFNSSFIKRWRIATQRLQYIEPRPNASVFTWKDLEVVDLTLELQNTLYDLMPQLSLPLTFTGKGTYSLYTKYGQTLVQESFAKTLDKVQASGFDLAEQLLDYAGDGMVTLSLLNFLTDSLLNLLKFGIDVKSIDSTVGDLIAAKDKGKGSRKSGKNSQIITEPTKLKQLRNSKVKKLLKAIPKAAAQSKLSYDWGVAAPIQTFYEWLTDSYLQLEATDRDAFYSQALLSDTIQGRVTRTDENKTVSVGTTVYLYWLASSAKNYEEYFSAIKQLNSIRTGFLATPDDLWAVKPASFAINWLTQVPKTLFHNLTRQQVLTYLMEAASSHVVTIKEEENMQTVIKIRDRELEVNVKRITFERICQSGAPPFNFVIQQLNHMGIKGTISSANIGSAVAFAITKFL